MARTKVLTVTKSDLRIETFRVGGAGGQRRDKVETGVRITHPASGSVGQSTEYRLQGQNKRQAFRRMAKDPKFMVWARRQAAGVARIELEVDKSMHPSNLRIEVRENGRWVTVPA